jgi:16S rRNA (cytidine1402-2'-O)-methyltransferase
LLNHLNINKKAVSFHEHSNLKKLDWVIDELKSGKNLAFVSDAGTPNLSDPGGKLVEAALEVGIEVSPIPGPSSLTALISVAPFSCSNFQFLGYFPKKKGREKMAEYLKNQDMPVFFLESPYRIHKTLDLLAGRLTNHHILIGRELTKKFEQIIYASLQDKKTFETIPPKGEFVFAIVRRDE